MRADIVPGATRSYWANRIDPTAGGIMSAERRNPRLSQPSRTGTARATVVEIGGSAGIGLETARRARGKLVS
jgi:hypothetical protein